MVTRIEKFESFISNYNNTNLCFKITKDQLLCNNGINLKVVKKLGKGSKHIVYLISDASNFFTFRVSQEVEPLIVDIASERYSLIFSDMVKNNRFPNFLMANTYICDDKITANQFDIIGNRPVSIQEYSDGGDLEKFIMKNDLQQTKLLILQSMLTFFFLHNINLAVNDAKAQNIVINNVESTNLCYNYENTYVQFSTNKVASLIDFDDITSNTVPFDRINDFYDQYSSDAFSNLSKYEQKDKYKGVISDAETILKSTQNYFKRDICTFLCSIMSIKKINIKYLDFCYEFINDYIILKRSFWECLHRAFGDVCTITNTANSNYLMYSLDNTNIKIDHTNNQYNTIYKVVQMYDELNYGSMYPDMFLKTYVYDKYKLNRFEDIDNSLENYLSNIKTSNIELFNLFSEFRHNLKSVDFSDKQLLQIFIFYESFKTQLNSDLLCVCGYIYSIYYAKSNLFTQTRARYVLMKPNKVLEIFNYIYENV